MPQATSKYISEDDTEYERVLKTSLGFSVLVGLIFFMIIFTGAERIAHFLNDPTLTPYIKMISLMAPFCAPFAVIQGYYNGIRDYRTQAGLIILYNVAKPLLIFVFVFMGLSIWGSVLGLSISPIIPLFIGLYLIRSQNIWRASGFPLKRILQFSVPIVVFSAAINLIMNLDLFFVKRVLMINELAGYYSAASIISKVPYTLMSAVTLTLFPAVSNTTHNPAKIQEYISESLRYTLLFTLPVTAIVAATSAPLVSLLYSGAYSPAGEPLRVLIVGISIFSIFAVLTTVISGTGRPKVAMFLSIVVLAIDYLLNVVMVPTWGMIGAAGATSISCAIGMAIGATYVYMRYGVLTSASSAIKILFASMILYALLSSVNLTGVYLLLGYGALGIIYLVLLFAMGEIKERDILRIRSLLPARL